MSARTDDRARTQREHPQGKPGWAPTPDGRRLFYQEIDGPPPTVVFEGGLASPRSMWGLVQPALRGVARAVVYDRSGLGRSPGTARSRRLPDLAEDLNSLLDHLEQEQPDGGGPGFVLVGHSLGGPIVRLATMTRPERIRGLVLVDPADEDCEVYYSPVSERSNRVQNTLFPPLARIGLLGQVYALTAGWLPPRIRADARREMYTPTAVATQIAESSAMADDLRALQARAPVELDQPVTIISGRKSAGIGATARRQMIEAHEARAATFERGRHLVAERSGHVVMRSEPELVAEEIRALVAGIAVRPDPNG